MNKIITRTIFILFLVSLLSTAANAEILGLEINNIEYEAGESAEVIGFLLDDSYNGVNDTNVSIYFNGTLNGTPTTNREGSFEHFINNLATGNHTLNATAAGETQTITFEVLPAASKPSYQIIASSLTVPYSNNPSLTFTVKKFLGDTLTTQSYDYSIYYENGTLYNTSTGTSNTAKTITLPSQVGTYKVVVDSKKSFSVSVAKFDLKYKITDKSGSSKDIFKPNGVAYFEVEGYSNSQKITNATVTAKVTSSSGTTKTVTFTETSSGLYKGNTNVTQGTAIQLQSGNYKTEFIMKDGSNNEQKVKGFFKVLGLSVQAKLVDKKPYKTGDTAEFDLIVKNLENGNLLEYSDISSYKFELEKDGNIYKLSESASDSNDPTLTSELSYTIPAGLEDGDYFLRVKADADGKIGRTKEYFEVMNTEVFLDITDNFDSFRDIFKPGELAKATIYSSADISFISLSVEDKNGVVKTTNNDSTSGTTGSLTFNVPQTQGEYLLKVTTTTNGKTVKRDRWFRVQNYASWLDVKDITPPNDYKFILQTDETFLGEINVFDITTGQGVDVTDFVVKFDKIVNEETGSEYTNIQSSLNTTYTDKSTGRITYKLTPPTLPNGIYRIEYTLVNNKGKSFKGKGWFGISAFDVIVRTYDANGREKEIFSPGATVNVSVTITSDSNGTATIHREFFSPEEFTLTNGQGSTLLTAAENELPSQAGFYGFGVEVENQAGEAGFGDGFFEIRSLNFRSIATRNNGKFGSGSNIIADVVMEKSGSLVNDTNVTLSRVTRARDGFDVTSQLSLEAGLTSNLGKTVVNITQNTTLNPGEYFVELKATKGNDVVFDGFSFRITQNNVLITINDEDNLFSQTENIEVNVKVTDQSNNPQANVTVNLTGLLNFATWATVAATKQATTNNIGVATMTMSAANYQTGRYAPIVRVEGMSNEIVGFGQGEFEIKPFTSNVVFANGQESYGIDESILFNVSVTGTVTVTATVEDINGNVQDVDYYYANKVLTLSNDLEPGEYFIDVTMTQSSKSNTKTLWFEVQAPWVHIHPLENPNIAPGETFNFDYTVFTHGASGWEAANATLTITEIENMWTGATTTVNESFNTSTNATGDGNKTFIPSESLSTGDYLLNIEIEENPEYENSLYFRLDKNARIMVEPQEPQGKNVTINVNSSGLAGTITHTLEEYENFYTFARTSDGSQTTGADVSFTLNGLENGFYRATIKTEDDTDTYYRDAYFEIRDRDVLVEAPMEAFTGIEYQFNVTNNGQDTNFWIINTFTQNVKYKSNVSAGSTLWVNQTFSAAGFYIYSYGADKWEAYKNSQGLDVQQQGFSVDWPYNDNRYVLTENKNFTFNVTEGKDGSPLVLNVKNLFSGEKTQVNAGTYSGGFQFSMAIQDMNLTTGPHDVELVMQDGTSEPPRDYFFIDIFPDNYDIWSWTEKWEYSSGENVTVNIEVYNITDNWNRVNPDSADITRMDGPAGPVSNPNNLFTLNGNIGTLEPDNQFSSGDYHGELNVTVGGSSRVVPFDFFYRGNDDIELYWQQNKWDYAAGDEFRLTVTAKDKGEAAPNMEASLTLFEQWPENWNETPTNMMNSVNNSYNFTPANKTGSDGKVLFKLDTSGLPTGGYTGRLNIGGQAAWFDFQIRTYQVDSFTSEWEYGITDTIEVNVRARNILTWDPITENGNVTISKINKHLPGEWEPQSVPLSAFGITNPTFEVVDGEAFIEMQANQTVLNLTQPYEFEIKLDMDLETTGASEGWAWFRLSNGTKPGLTIIDTDTSQEAENIFGGKTYQLQVTGAQNATLRNIWGPSGRTYNQGFDSNGDTLVLNFTTPEFPGFYSLEVEIQRSGSDFTDYLYQDFTIGSGTELEVHTEGTSNIVPGVNFTVFMDLFGEGEDPWCISNPDDQWCQEEEHSWFGPLGNKTVQLTSVKNLETFTTIDLTGLNKTAVTEPFQIMGSGESDCMQYENDTDACNSAEGCSWFDDGQGGFCEAEMMEEDMEGPGEMSMPGTATMALNSDLLNLTPGGKYDLLFSYTENNETTTGKIFVQVEQFHVSISKREENLKSNTNQSVWLKTSRFNGSAISGCNVTFEAIYNEKDFQKVKTLDIAGTTDANGTMVFKYKTPSLPGEYFVEGVAACAVDSESIEQDIGYFMEVGARALIVDMKSKFEEGENIKLVIETKDAFGNPKAQNLDLNLFHDFDFSSAIQPEQGIGCTPLVAGSFDSWSTDNYMQVSTDNTGYKVLELCPLPRGEYFLDIFPIFDFSEPQEPGEFDDNAFFSDFVVTSSDIEIDSGLTYQVGDTVVLNITISDEDGNPMNGTLIFADAIMESFDMGSEVIVNESDNLNVSFTDGNVSYSFTIPAQGEDEMSGNMTDIGMGPVDVAVIIKDSEGRTHSKSGLQFMIVRSDKSQLTAPATAGVNELIDVHVETDNDEAYKAEMGVFFLQDNPEKMKDWFIEGAVFFESNEAENKSEADFQILSPKDPGRYYLAIPVFKLGISPKQISQASDMLIAPIEVKLPTVNVNGRVTNEAGSGVANAKVQIGKAETYTTATGHYEMEVAKGYRQVYVEAKSVSGRHSLESNDKLNFDVDKELNATMYYLHMSGTVQPSNANINKDTNLDTYLLNVTLDLNNTGSEDLLGAESMVKAGTTSEDVLEINSTDAIQTLQQVKPENVTGDYYVFAKVKDPDWNSAGYMTLEGVGVENTVSVSNKYSYNVNSTLKSTETYVEYCGNGFCSYNESLVDSESYCSADCEGTDQVCGNGDIEGDEWCDGNNTAGQQCTDFGYDYGQLGCFNDCMGWDFYNCHYNESQPMDEGLDDHLNITAANTANNDTTIEFEFTVVDLSDSAYCNGTSPDSPGEYEEWAVGIDSKPGEGCNIQECWTDEDYVAYAAVNYTGDVEPGFDYWDEVEMAEDFSVIVEPTIDCGNDKVILAVDMADVNVSCGETINLRYETWFMDEMGDTMEDSAYTATCGGEPSAPASVEILAPQPDEVLTDDNISIVYNVSGDLTDYGYTWIFLDDGSAYNTTRSDGVGERTVNDFNSVPETGHQLTVGLTNVSGGFIAMAQLNFTINLSEEEVVVVMVDLLSPTPGQTVGSSDVSVTYNITGDPEDYDYTWVYLDDGSVFNTTTPDGVGQQTTPFNGVPDGTHEANVVVYSNSMGSMSGFDNATFTVDTGGMPSQNVSLSGYSVEGFDGELCVYEVSDSYMDCVQPDESYFYNMTNVPPGIYDIEANLGDVWNTIEISSYNLSADTEMNFTLWDEGFEVYAITSNSDNLTLDTNEHVDVNISLPWSFQPSYSGLSVTVSVEQINETKDVVIEHLIKDANFSITENESYIFDAGDFFINSSKFDLGHSEIEIAIWEMTNSVVTTDKGETINAKNILFFEENRTIISDGGEMQGSGLEGNVSGSIVEGATIEIRENNEEGALAANITTNSSSEFSMVLDPGVYHATVLMPQTQEWQAYKDMVVEVENITVSSMETMYVSIPHIFGMLVVDGMPMTIDQYPVEMVNGTPTNVSILVNNTESFSIDAMFQLDASNIGDMTIYENDSTTISGGGVDSSLSYVVTPSIIGTNPNGLLFDLELNLAASNVLQGSIAQNSTLRVAIDNVVIPINVTTGGS